jgi:hypothetical protein
MLRSRLEDPRTGQQQVFASLEMILAGLEEAPPNSMGEIAM